MTSTVRRGAFVFLAALPFLNLAAASPRALRVPGLHQSLGVVLCALSAIAMWVLGARAIFAEEAGKRLAALAGTFLLLPWLLIALLWVGIGPPFEATLQENHMRFVVLLTNAVLVVSGVVLLREALAHLGERVDATVGFALGLVGGTLYVAFLSISLAVVVAMERVGNADALQALSGFYDVLEFVGCLSTYVATAAFALSMRRVRWLGRGPACAYVAVCAVCVVLLVLRGLEYPEISSRTAPWYTQPGVIVGIPAVPWIMPCLLGVLALRSAGETPARAPVIS